MVDGALKLPIRDDLILGAVFAGGASRRYGSDKALALLNGIPLLGQVISRVQPQVDVLVISGPPRADFRLLTIVDAVPDAGPLSALCSVLAWAEQERFPLVATFSCDAPFVPPNLVQVLHEALQDHDCAVACRMGSVHPTFAVWKTDIREKISRAFAGGVHSLRGAVAGVDHTLVNFPTVDFPAVRGGPDNDPFFNINTPGDMAMAALAR